MFSKDLYMIRCNNSGMFTHRISNSVFICFMPFTLFKVFESFVTVSTTISEFVGVAFHVLFNVSFICMFVGASFLGTLYWWAYMVHHMSREFGFSEVFLATSNHCISKGWFGRMFYFVNFQLTVKREHLVTIAALYLLFKMGVGVFSE